MDTCNILCLVAEKSDVHVAQHQIQVKSETIKVQTQKLHLAGLKAEVCVGKQKKPHRPVFLWQICFHVKENIFFFFDLCFEISYDG